MTRPTVTDAQLWASVYGAAFMSEYHNMREMGKCDPSSANSHDYQHEEAASHADAALAAVRRSQQDPTT